MLDLHGLFRAPDYLRGPVEWYIGLSHDPFVGVSSGALGDSSHLAHLGWFKSFLVLELYSFFPPSSSQNTTKILNIPGSSNYQSSSQVHEDCIKVFTIFFVPKDFSRSFLKNLLTRNPRLGCRTIYPLLALYAASTATTTLACVFQVLQTPKTTPETLAQNLPSITADQRLLLLSSYIPYFLIPFIMAVDMGMRTHELVKIAIKKEEKQD